MASHESNKSSMSKFYEKKYFENMEKLLSENCLKNGGIVIQLRFPIRLELENDKLFISMVGKASKNYDVAECDEELLKPCIKVSFGQYMEIKKIIEEQTEKVQNYLKLLKNENEETQKILNEISSFSIRALMEFCEENRTFLPMQLNKFLKTCQSFHKALYTDLDVKLIEEYQIPSVKEFCEDINEVSKGQNSTRAKKRIHRNPNTFIDNLEHSKSLSSKKSRIASSNVLKTQENMNVKLAVDSHYRPFMNKPININYHPLGITTIGILNGWKKRSCIRCRRKFNLSPDTVVVTHYEIYQFQNKATNFKQYSKGVRTYCDSKLCIKAAFPYATKECFVSDLNNENTLKIIEQII